MKSWVFQRPANARSYVLTEWNSVMSPFLLSDETAEAIGGIEEVGPWDAWDAAKGDLASDAQEFAKQMAERYGCTPAQRARIANAARHAYWQAMLTRKHGELSARKLGDLHEQGETNLDSQVDQRNNPIGRRIGRRASSAEDVRGMVEAALLRGELFGANGTTISNITGLTPCTRRPPAPKGCPDSSSSDSSSDSSSSDDSSSPDDSSY